MFDFVQFRSLGEPERSTRCARAETFFSVIRPLLNAASAQCRARPEISSRLDFTIVRITPLPLVERKALLADLVAMFGISTCSSQETSLIHSRCCAPVRE